MLREIILRRFQMTFKRYGIGLTMLGFFLVSSQMFAQTQSPAPAVLAFQTFEAGDGFAAGLNAATTSEASGFGGSSTKSVNLTLTAAGFPGDEAQLIKVTAPEGSTVDVTAFKYMFFWIKDTVGANTHYVTLIDSAGAKWSGWVDTKSIQDKWVKIVLPVKTATGVDLKTLKEIRIGEWNAGTYYIDDIYFGNRLADKLP